jgi:hypothetical protein
MTRPSLPVATFTISYTVSTWNSARSILEKFLRDCPSSLSKDVERGLVEIACRIDGPEGQGQGSETVSVSGGAWYIHTRTRLPDRE